MATVRKLPSGKWNATAFYKDPITGKTSRPSFTAPTKAEAIRMAAEWEADKSRAASPREMTVGECIDRYITAKESALSPATLREYRRMQAHDYFAIEKISIKNLSNEDIQLFVSDLCKGHSPKTVRNIYALLTSSIEMFSQKRYRVTLPQRKPVEYNIPTDEQVKSLMAEADPTLRLNIALAAIGTLREGEIAALYYRDVDYVNKGVYIHADMVRGANHQWVIKDIPKTSSSVRFVQLPDKIMAMIGEGKPDQRIYPHTPRTIYKAFVKVRKKLGLNCRFHDLRHYAASIMHALGIPDQYIMERGGWKSDTVLKSVYRNTLSDQSQKFAAVANDHFARLL